MRHLGIFLHFLQAVWLWCTYSHTRTSFDLVALGQLKCYNFGSYVLPKTTNSNFKPKPGISQGVEEVEEMSKVCESSDGNQRK